MRRRNYGGKELDELQTLKKENQRLKKQVASLRKQITRLDLDRYSNLKELIEKHYNEDQAQEKEDILQSLKKEWQCHTCLEGFLQLKIFHRRDGTFYYRACNRFPVCRNRTKTKRYHEDVKGIKADDTSGENDNGQEGV